MEDNIMTGKELIIYILENNLEDEQIFKDGRFIGFMTLKEAASKFEVGESTVRVWIHMGLIKGFRFNDEIFIPGNSENPKLKYVKGKINE